MGAALAPLGLGLALLLFASATAVAMAVRSARSLASLDRIRELAEDGDARAAAALVTMQEDDRSAGLVRVVVPLTGVLVGWAVSLAVRALVPDEAYVPVAVAAVLVVGAALALLCDAVPRAAALSSPERVLVVLGWPYRSLVAVLGPLVTVSGWLATALLYPAGLWLDGGRGRAHTADELAELVDDDRSTEETAGSRLFAGALGFLDVRVGDVMARRDRLVTVPRTSTVEEAEDLVHRSGHSRVLVLGDSGEVTGFLHAKDLIALPPEQRGGFLPPGLVRLALRVEPEDRVEDVLPRMRRARRHVAVVATGDEVLGLVTLEDVLEAIVGDIRDESDVEGPDR